MQSPRDEGRTLSGPHELQLTSQMLVEGRDAQVFFDAMLRSLQRKDIQVHDYGGGQQLRPFLRTLRLATGFDRVRTIGIVRDAESDPAAAFQSTCDGLERAGLSAPDRTEVVAPGNPSVVVLILPDSSTPGMLETLCLRSVATDPVMGCVDAYSQCLQNSLTPSEFPRVLDKARVQAFLASRRDLRRLVGEAANAGYWQWEHAAFDHIRSFINLL